jgi:hypothetical protein
MIRKQFTTRLRQADLPELERLSRLYANDEPTRRQVEHEQRRRQAKPNEKVAKR